MTPNEARRIIAAFDALYIHLCVAPGTEQGELDVDSMPALCGHSGACLNNFGAQAPELLRECVAKGVSIVLKCCE